MVKDSEAVEKLMPTALGLVRDSGKIAEMEKNAGALAKMDAAQTIIGEVYKLV